MRYPDGNAVRPDAIKEHLRTSFLGRTIVHAASTASTNEDAKAMGAEYPDGTVFMADVQTGGKGRIGRRWSSPRGGIFMSAALKPPTPPSEMPVLSIVAGYCVATAIRETLDLDARLKWPNDVLAGGRKVCGILCEMVTSPDRAPLVVVGIGVNANIDANDLPSEVRETASSLKALLEHEIDANTLTAAILNRFEPAYQEFLESGLSGLAQDIQGIAAFVGEPVAVRNVTAADSSDTQGIFRGIDGRGRAIVEVPGGERLLLSAGDLSLRVRN